MKSVGILLGVRLHYILYGIRAIDTIAMSSASSASSPSSLGQLIYEKLTHDNFILWKAQVVSIVRGARFFGYLDGTVVEPAHTNAAHGAWVAQAQ
jgi:hypothetical protein